MTQKPNGTLSRTRALILLTACGLLAGCSTTQLVTSQKSPKYTGAGFKKILVLGIAKRPEIRKIYEDEFVKQLKDVGVEGVSSIPWLPSAEKADKATVAQAMAKSGADAVLVTRLVKVDKVQYTYSPDMYLSSYIESAMPDAYNPEAVASYEVMTLESRLFDGSNAQVVWTGTTRTVDPTDVQKAVSDLSKDIVKALASQNLIVATQTPAK